MVKNPLPLNGSWSNQIFEKQRIRIHIQKRIYPSKEKKTNRIQFKLAKNIIFTDFFLILPVKFRRKLIRNLIHSVSGQTVDTALIKVRTHTGRVMLDFQSYRLKPVMWIRIDCIRIHKIWLIQIQVNKITKLISRHKSEVINKYENKLTKYRQNKCRKIARII